MNFSPAFARYVQCDTLMHRLDMRTKLIVVLAVMTVIVIVDSWESLLWISAITLLTVFSAKVSLSELFRSIWSFRFFYIVTILLHTLLGEGESVLNLPFGLNVTVEGVERGLLFSFKIMLLSLTILPFFRSTHPAQFSNMALLSKISMKNLRQISLMFGLSVRFLPMMMDEFERIRWAQVSRGLNVKGSLSHRIRTVGILIGPMIGSAFQRAENLSAAMQARAFVVDQPRSSFRISRFGWNDALFITLTLLLLCGSFLHPLTKVV